MRPELTKLEQIDRYISGDLSPDQVAAFEHQMAGDPVLRNEVEQQKELVQAMNRQVLRSQIAAVAAASGGGGSSTNGSWGNWLMGLGGAVVIGVGTTAAVAYYQNSEDEVSTNEELVLLEEDSPVTVQVDSIKSDVYVLPDEQIITEEPETIFSSANTYEGEDDRMSVTVNFQPRGMDPGESVKLPTNTESKGVIISEDPVQRPAADVNSRTEYKDHSKRASFPGGNQALKKFIDKNLRYPKSAKDKSIEGVVRCDFHVTADGQITEIEAECISMSERDGMPFSDMRLLMNKKLMNSFIGNATHVLRTMPNWEPARNTQGNPIISAQRMYFNYDMVKGCLVYQLDDELPIHNESVSNRDKIK